MFYEEEIYIDKHLLSKTVEELCKPESYTEVMHRGNHDIPMPSAQILSQIMENLRSVIFPGYFEYSHTTPETIKYYTGFQLDEVMHLLAKQIKRGFCFSCSGDELKCMNCDARAKEITEKFIRQLPDIRYMLSTDTEAAYEGDPAAKSKGEAVFCYPSIRTMTNYRIAHALYILGVPLIPRIITELAHSETGIDIHPGAQISEKFFMDHGTGIVIGETCIIGKNVRIYQGVTLGAKSFPLDKNGNPVKGIKRHPNVEDNVIIYSGATILGNISIGKNTIIGGNVWITDDIPPNSKITQSIYSASLFKDGAGI